MRRVIGLALSAAGAAAQVDLDEIQLQRVQANMAEIGDGGHDGASFMSAEEEGVMEMTEFIFQDLKGSLPPGLMNAALPAGTLQANAMEMDILKGKK